MNREVIESIDRLCRRQPGLRHKIAGSCHNIKGQLTLNHELIELGIHIQDTFEILINFSVQPDGAPPRVFEIGKRIPHELDWHIFPNSGRACLGSPLRLKYIWRKNPDIDHFAQKIVEPYYVAISAKLGGHDSFVFGELSHGTSGLHDDYASLFGVEDRFAAQACLLAMLKKKRQLKNTPCPCRCGKRLLDCDTWSRIQDISEVITENEIKKARRIVLSEIEKVKK